MNAELRYAYAVAPPGLPPLPEGLRGVASTVPRALEHAGLTAVVGTVPADDFAEQPLRAHLEDLDWLAETARAHQAVVDALTEVTTPLPLRLATVHHDDDSVRRSLEADREELAGTLDRLAGRVEWGVKVYAETDRAQRRAAPAASPSAAGAAPEGGARSPADAAPGSGRAYLRRRMRAVSDRESALDEAENTGRTLHAALAAYAEDVRLHPPQDPRLSGALGQNLLNAAYLVPRERAGRFVERAEQLGAHDPVVRVEVTGPWAPYSFVAPASGRGRHAGGAAAEASS